MESRIAKEIDVRYMDTAFSMKTNLITLLGYFNEIAQVAGDYYAQKHDIFKLDQIAWILVNWQVKILRFPIYKERLLVSTIAHLIDRFYAYRNFYIQDASEMIIAEGKSRWILMDFAAKKATEAREFMWDLYGVRPETSPFSIDMPVRMSTEGYRTTYTVVPSDIDIYNHVNNVVYARWICDAIGPLLTESGTLKEFRIHYKKEAALKEEISLLSQINRDTQVHTKHLFQNEDGANLAYACTRWEEAT